MRKSVADLSVVIPTHNRSSWLVHAIESVLAQSLPAREVIVVDDGSTDDTDEVVARYSGLTYLRREQGGPSAARNAGAAISTGRWLAFLDSDDRWLPAKIERQLQWLEAHPGVEAVYTDEIWIRKGVRVNQCKYHAKRGGYI
ncbi:MAG: glycosyltransferase family 2 protein, partial [Planctomycetes bacterium]|nr:glycosyltransferase family 2 protein [Planctomycetota bacterium]